MAQRRMFSPDIVESDAFLEMPLSSQSLYFHLAMRADDDGFVSPRMVMRLLGSTEDDLRVLLAKRFILSFDSGVVVIKHWLIHNLIRADLYKETLYLDEKNTLGLKDNGAYTELKEGVATLKKIEAPEWLKRRRGAVRTVNVPQTVPRLGKDRLGKVSNIEEKNKKFTPPSLKEVIEYCNERNNSVDPDNFINFYESKGWMVGKNKMKDWKAAIRTWEKNKQNQTQTKTHNFDQIYSMPDGTLIKKYFDKWVDAHDKLVQIDTGYFASKYGKPFDELVKPV